MDVAALKNRFIPKRGQPAGPLKFSNKELIKIIIPLIIEQFLSIFVGMVAIMMISQQGEQATSGIALIDTVNMLFINIFAALATGGAVITGYYIGQKKMERASKVAEQLVLMVTGISLLIMVLVLVGQNFILYNLFGDLEPVTRGYAKDYLNRIVFAIPFIGLYNSAAALFRVTGDTRTPMNISLLMNGINIALNYLFIFILDMSVRGSAIATLISRIAASVILIIMLHDKKRAIHLGNLFKTKPDISVIKRMLYIGVPNGLENSMFQIGKILVVRLVASFGAVSIAANGIAASLAGYQVLPGAAMGFVVITVVSQCVGARDYEQGRYYTKKLLKMAYVSVWVLNAAIFLFLPNILGIYNFAPETLDMIRQVAIYHGICVCLIWPLSFTLPNTLRASGDMKYSMTVSVLSMWICRIVFSYILGRYLKMGLMGVWVAMTLDWTVRGICFICRYINGKWTRQKI